ncbi:hypothetical protein [Caproiciproducens sp. LBM24188]|nr:hypothetical protein [Oscillospiraceae bacterium]HHV32380.1 YpmS family protein [Clostridiales bacterium]
MLRMVEEPRKKKRPWLIVLSVLVGLFALLGIFALLALNDPGRDSVPANPDSGTVLTKLGAAALNKEPAQISEQELNGFLSASYKTMPPQCKIQPDNTLELYMPVNYKGIRVGVTAHGSAAFDLSRQQLALKFSSVRIGRLPVPTAFALNLAKDYLPDGFFVEDDLVYLDTSAAMGGDYSSFTGIQITGMEIFDQKLIVSVAGDPNKFKEFIVQSLPDLLKLFQ